MNKYHKKDVRLLIDWFKKRAQDALDLPTENSGTSRTVILHTAVSWIEAYGYTLPSHWIPFFKPEVNSFLFHVPFTEVPKHLSNKNLKLLVEWRLQIGR